MSVAEDATSGRLRIVIVGAGIGGLAAAIALRRQGHQITLLERSRFAKEFGAAVHIAPNCYGILKRLGLRVETIGALELTGLESYKQDGSLELTVDLKEKAGLWQHPWMMVHRVNLHIALKELATATSGLGSPATLKTSSGVASVDANAGIVTCHNGEEYSADVIIGADGVHSVCRDVVTGGTVKPHGSGKSGYRFLIPSDLLRSDAKAQWMVSDGHFKEVMGADRRFIGYPCNNNTLMNCFFPFPTEEADPAGDGYHQAGDKDRMLHAARAFGEPIQAVLAYANPEDVNVWELLDMDDLSTWVTGRLALLGDARGPFQPWLGQGAAMAIEDAASIAAMLPRGTPKIELSERLKLYEECRHPRANKMLDLTRRAGADTHDGHDNHLKLTLEATPYAFGHDAWDYSTQRLREWKRSRSGLTTFMPVSIDLDDMSPPTETRQVALTASARFKTSRTILENLLPNAFKFASPATVAHASWICIKRSGHVSSIKCGLLAHDVIYVKGDGEKLHGDCLIVEFDNSVENILAGREQFGLPLTYADIHMDRTANELKVDLSNAGTTFGSLKFGLSANMNGSNDGKSTQNQTTGSTPQSNDATPILTYKFVPAVQGAKADLEYAVSIPRVKNVDADLSVRENKALVGEEDIRFSSSMETNTGMARSVHLRLSELPIIDVVGATVTEGGRDERDEARAERLA